jgi:hypothetical protein
LHKIGDQYFLTTLHSQTVIRHMSQSLNKLLKVHNRLSTVLFEDDVDFSARDLLEPFTSLVSNLDSFLHKLEEHRRLDARLV